MRHILPGVYDTAPPGDHGKTPGVEGQERHPGQSPRAGGPDQPRRHRPLADHYGNRTLLIAAASWVAVNGGLELSQAAVDSRDQHP